MASNFEIAALDAARTDPIEEITAELKINDHFITLWRRPTPGQLSAFQLRWSRGRGTEQGKAFDIFFGNIMLTPDEIIAPGRLDEDGLEYATRIPERKQEAVGLTWVLDLMERGLVEEGFLLDLMREAIEQHAGFPTKPAAGSSPSPTPSGPPSTARSRRQGSTPSA